jgi:RNA polymerase sigma-70 factor, ECF subfamily
MKARLGSHPERKCRYARTVGGLLGQRQSAAARPDDLAPCVVAAQRGDERAFDRLYVTVQPGLLRYLRGLVGADAEDVAAEAWLQIVRDLPGLQTPSGFRGWAAAIARHRALDHLRRTKRRPAVATPMEDLAQLAAQHHDPADDAIDSVSTDAALALIASLPADQAEAVLLRVVVGLDTNATAAVLGKRPGAVRAAAHRGLRRLASRLSQAPPDPGRRAVTSTALPTPKPMR